MLIIVLHGFSFACAQTVVLKNQKLELQKLVQLTEMNNTAGEILLKKTFIQAVRDKNFFHHVNLD